MVRPVRRCGGVGVCVGVAACSGSPAAPVRACLVRWVRWALLGAAGFAVWVAWQEKLSTDSERHAELVDTLADLRAMARWN